MTPGELTGRVRTHIVETQDPPAALHRHAAASFLALRRCAAADGFDLIPVSTFRDFERQLSIWNRKWNGETPIDDADGRPLSSAALSADERIDAILLWSALPGASRHHWGTDLDVIDRRALPPGYRVQLIPAEYTPPGPFAPLAAWLDLNASRFGFFRPYRGILSGVRPEPWHFSFAPIADPARRRLTPAVLADVLANADLAGKEAILPRIDELHARYVAAIDWP